MKKVHKIIVLASLAGCLALGGVYAWAVEPGGEVVEEEENVTDDGVKILENLNIETSVEGNEVNVKIQNTTDEDIKNLAIVYDNSGELIGYENIWEYGVLEAGSSVRYTVASIDMGSGIFRDIAVAVGGFRYALLLIPVFVGCVGVVGAVWIIRQKFFSGRRGWLVLVIGSVLTVIAVVATGVVLGRTVGSREYILKDTGENYTRSFSEEIATGGVVSFEVKYNQDIVSYETVEKDVEIPYDVEYEYDESIECTAESKVKKTGIPGKKHVITKITYRNGEKAEEESTETVITDPISQVEVQGTKTVIETQNVEAYKEYVPDDSMEVGEFQLQTSAVEARSHVGKKEVTWNWDKQQEKVVSTEEVTVQPGVDVWKAGTRVTVTETVKATTEYEAVEEEEVGFREEVEEAVDGSRTTIYRAEIDTSTGKRVDGTELEYVSSESTDPVNGLVRVGVLKVEEVVTPRAEDVTYDPDRWSYEETVQVEGADLVEKVSSIMIINQVTGEVTDKVEREVDREVVQGSVNRVVTRGSKEPNWVEEKVITGEVEYNTVYVADEKLEGDEQVVVQEGEKGSLYTTRLIAVDDEGNILEGYEPQIVQEDALSDSKDRIVHVAPDSPLLG